MSGGTEGLLHIHLNFLAFKTPGSLNFLTSICIYLPQNIYAEKSQPFFLLYKEFLSSAWTVVVVVVVVVVAVAVAVAVAVVVVVVISTRRVVKDQCNYIILYQCPPAMLHPSGMRQSMGEEKLWLLCSSVVVVVHGSSLCLLAVSQLLEILTSTSPICFVQDIVVKQ